MISLWPCIPTIVSGSGREEGTGGGRLPTSSNSSWVGFAFSFRLSVMAFSKAGVLVTMIAFLFRLVSSWLKRDQFRRGYVGCSLAEGGLFAG